MKLPKPGSPSEAIANNSPNADNRGNADQSPPKRCISRVCRRSCREPAVMNNAAALMP